MRKSKKNNRIKILLILLLTISVGYALLATTLKLNGSALVKKQNWNVYWSNAQVTTGSVSMTAPTIGEDQGEPVKSKASWNVTFTEPGQFYEFTIDATNAGSIDAKIVNVVNKVNNRSISSLPEYIKYSATYIDGTEPANNDILAKATVSGGVTTPTTKKYKVRVEYDGDLATAETINNMPAEGLQYNFEFDVQYYQPNLDPRGPIQGENFSTDSWETIAAAVRAGNYPYQVGDTKTIEMDMNNDGTPETYTVRVANTSSPVECELNDFSQTACGFVVEFVDIIDNYKMNSTSSNFDTTIGVGANGGWKYSLMRSYVNNKIFDKLPSDLQDVIVPTKVVSGHNGAESDNYVTTDKLFLLAAHELWEDADNLPNHGLNHWDTSYEYTRQLDYYANLHIATSCGVGEFISQANTAKIYTSPGYEEGYETDWWTRSTSSKVSICYYYGSQPYLCDGNEDDYDGYTDYYGEFIGTNFNWPDEGASNHEYDDLITNSADGSNGVSPAFKIG